MIHDWKMLMYRFSATRACACTDYTRFEFRSDACNHLLLQIGIRRESILLSGIE